MIDWQFRTIIVPDAIVATVRSLTDPLPAADGMFRTALSPTGAEPATHWISTGYIDEPFAVMLSSPQALVDGLGAMGLALPLEQAELLLSMADVSEETPHTVMQRLGLSLVNGASE